jgi:hypothetical protein
MSDATQHTPEGPLIDIAEPIIKGGPTNETNCDLWDAPYSEVLAAWKACRYIPDPEVTVPELVEALDKLIKSIERWETEVEKIIGRVPRTYIELDAARAALAGVKRKR